MFCVDHELENRKKAAKHDRLVKNKAFNIPVRKSATVTPKSKTVTPGSTKVVIRTKV